jgi:HEAT repeat protein
MRKTIEEAIAASKQNNWSLVNQCLQQLPLESKHHRLLSLDKCDRDRVIGLALQVLHESDFQQRWEVAKLFSLIGKEAIGPLIAILEDEAADIEMRWFVARILSEFDDSACIIALVKLLQQTEEEELSQVASQALVNIGNTAIEALKNLLEQPGSRLLAVRSLSQIRRSDIIEPLLKVIDDPNVEIRAIAIEALGSFHDERIIPVLLEALKDRAAGVRKEAAIALGIRGPMNPQLVEPLKPLLYDIRLEICQQTAIALGRIGTDRAADALFTVFQSPVTPVELKLTVVRALSWIETPQALTYLKKGLYGGEIALVNEIIALLGRKELEELKSQATQILLEFYQAEEILSQQPQIKQSLAMSLGNLGQKDAIGLILDLTKDSDRTVELHAIAALKKFGN